mmetsp:Transcript_110277/g.351512  ORF Transcript_110277/g.351512 Transcript_110277/m.351512 type:complete len:1415 (-) Transcript_110277:22-4266(-)|eukprot:CAMPEP_0204208172 /NCGR_PEP_ID=MMETSP0361-20130328/72301_1 /ASSEMBLY_ACC=CAM_ASM_000343 /TAXON_ID=268821 /ORGANISM="Scrippsiella Hangoei, Strain SHTV-5" /LENGTH=1414 /DNA_ID=CAMNT_0051171905 /DNA_START=53 /DNA_END=4297 /DNA_ORIENTATION=+
MAEEAAEGAVAAAISPEDLRAQLDIALHGTGVDLKALKGPKAVLAQKAENKAVQEALDKFNAGALALGPRTALLDGTPSVLSELLDIALGKKKGAKQETREQALTILETMAWATPLLVGEPLQALIALHGDAKVGKPCLETATAIMKKFTPKGHGVVQLVLPTIMTLVEDKNWKVRIVGLKLLPSALQQMQHTTKQLSELLSRLLPLLLAGPLMEPRKEVQDAARETLEVIGKLVRNSEVSRLSADVVQAVADPANQKYTQEALAKLGGTTFMNYMDAASLALLVPIMTRGLKEREQKSRKWSAQILGAIVTLVKDIEYLRPYLPTLLPLLKECAIDPTYQIQREAAKAFGMLTQELPCWSKTELQPWLCAGIASTDLGVSLGCAHSFSEVLLRLGRRQRDSFMNAIVLGAKSPEAMERRGFVLLLDFLLDAFKKDFVPYIRTAFPAMLAAVLPEPEDPALKACDALIARFGAACPELLLPGLEDIFFICQHEAYAFPTAVKHGGGYQCKRVHWQMRETYLKLMLKMCERILEHKQFGQDMLTCDDCSTRPVRESVMVLLEVMKEDTEPQVQRQAKHVWRICGGQPKTTKDVTPALEVALLKMREDPVCAMKRKSADALLKLLAEEGELGGGDAAGYLSAMPAPPALVEPESAPEAGAGTRKLLGLLGVKAAGGAAQPEGLAEEKGDGEETLEAAQAAAAREERHDREALARTGFESVFPAGSWDAAGEGAEAARSFCETMSASISVEALASRGLYGELKLKMQMVVDQYAKGTVTEQSVTNAARTVARSVFGEDSLTVEDEQEGEQVEQDRLLYVPDLMLMYGGGHLLLKDTVLELRRNRRYGVIGHNGCGKTTLMKELQAGRVAGMPKDVKCVHVSDAVLGDMKVMDMTSIAFMRADMPADSKISADEALLQVGFPKDMQEKSVSDLSGGWRMRLLLACVMMKEADILLLDEPTNHLDVHAIEWLCQYLLQAKTGALMVISHDPHFLNAVCTDIVQYKDKKLIYYKGNFDAFKQANAISDDDAEEMLMGNISADKERSAPAPGAEGEEGEDGEDGAEDVIVNAPKVAEVKLTFPIPGKLQGIANKSKPVMECRKVFFEYPGAKGQIIKGVTCRLTLASRVAMVGVNGAGKSTLLGLLCGELNPTEHEGKIGEVWQHENLRLSFIAQHHMDSVGAAFKLKPFEYLSHRFKSGWDDEAQKHLIEPRDEEERVSRREKATLHGKYGKQVGKILSRSTQAGKLMYEVQWEGMEDPKQNTFETMDKLRSLGVERFASACNLRLAAMRNEVRPLTEREVCRHVEQFGIDQEMCMNREIGGYSAGQKSKLALACAMWTKPHLLALDEPTNYLDQETVESLGRALQNFHGGVVVVTHSRDFIEKVCTEEWLVKDGSVTVNQLEGIAKEKVVAAKAKRTSK